MRRRSGVSYLITVVLMTLVAVALGTLLYAYFSGWVGSRTGTLAGPVGVLSAEEAYYNNTDFIVYVRNDGVGTVKIVRAYLTAPDGTVYFADISGNNYEVSPGTSVMVVIDPGSAGITSVSNGIWTIKLVADDGSSVTVTVKV